MLLSLETNILAGSASTAFRPLYPSCRGVRAACRPHHRMRFSARAFGRSGVCEGAPRRLARVFALLLDGAPVASSCRLVHAFAASFVIYSCLGSGMGCASVAPLRSGGGAPCILVHVSLQRANTMRCEKRCRIAWRLSCVHAVAGMQVRRWLNTPHLSDKKGALACVPYPRIN